MLDGQLGAMVHARRIAAEVRTVAIRHFDERSVANHFRLLVRHAIPPNATQHRSDESPSEWKLALRGTGR